MGIVLRSRKTVVKMLCRNVKIRLKPDYVYIRKQFDRAVQSGKRLHWYSLQKNLLDECNMDQSQFWKSIGKIGINYANKKSVPMEITLHDGTIATNISDSFCKWMDDFSSLFTIADQSAVGESETNCELNRFSNLQNAYNEHINILEVKKVISDAKRGKAAG